MESSHLLIVVDSDMDSCVRFTNHVRGQTIPPDNFKKYYFHSRKFKMSPVSSYRQFSLILFIICFVVWHSFTKHQVTKILREYEKQFNPLKLTFMIISHFFFFNLILLLFFKQGRCDNSQASEMIYTY